MLSLEVGVVDTFDAVGEAGKAEATLEAFEEGLRGIFGFLAFEKALFGIFLRHLDELMGVFIVGCVEVDGVTAAFREDFSERVGVFAGEGEQDLMGNLGAWAEVVGGEELREGFFV